MRERPPRAQRSSVSGLLDVRVAGDGGRTVPLSELIRAKEAVEDKSVYHRNLMPVVYVTDDVAGQAASPVYVIGDMANSIDDIKLPEGYKIAQHTVSAPYC